MKLVVKILISDFDNTFFTDNIKNNIKLVNSFMKEGNIFVIATGRPLYLLKPELIKLNIKYNYLICNDGAVIFDENDQIIDKTNIDYVSAVQIYNLLKRNSDIRHVYIDAIYDFGDLDVENFNGVLAMPYFDSDADDLIKDICKRFPTIQGYKSHKWINILSASANKGNAIKFLEVKNDWKESDIYVIGDNKNDISMTIYENSYGVKAGNKEFLSKCNYQVDEFKDLIEKLLIKPKQNTKK